MFNQGLSLDQAPPIGVPYRFFITAPIFGILLGLVFFFFPVDLIINRYSSVAIGVIHLFTLGMLSMIIFGAMQQMMPVLAGAVVKKPVLFANVVHTSLTLGTLCFSGSFIFEIKALLHIGTTFLAIAFFTFFAVSLYLIFKVRFLTSTVNAMKLFAIAGAITSLLGVYLAYSHISNNIGALHYNFVYLHILFGLFGFATVLIMGVSFQIIPMFYVALDFPKYIQNKIPIFIMASLFAFGMFLFLELDTYILKVLFGLFFILFCIHGLNSLNKRRRPVFDVTLWYWKLSLSFLLISMLNWLFVPQDSYFVMAIMFGLGFLYSLLQGMVYKIIPFLAWFHLSSKGHMMIPTMREMIHEDMIKLHFFIYVSSVFFFLISPFLSSFFILIAALLFIIANILFLINCITGVRKYSKIAKTNPMDAFANLS
ncbi:MAG: hypothetical protein WC141_05670 [Arcobacteraceae bacterium]